MSVLVQGCNHRDDIDLARILVCDLLDDRLCTPDIILVRLPLRGRDLMAGVVESGENKKLSDRSGARSLRTDGRVESEIHAELSAWDQISYYASRKHPWHTCGAEMQCQIRKWCQTLNPVN